MPFIATNAVGTIVEGRLALKNGVLTFVQDEDGPALNLNEVLQRWAGKKVRLNVVDLDTLAALVDAGMTPGNEQRFLEALSDEQVDDLLGGDDK